MFCIGLSIDGLIDGYIQTVLSSVAIDKMCSVLMPRKTFDIGLFAKLNQDSRLLAELESLHGYAK